MATEAALRYLCFTNELYQCLTNLPAPQVPRLVGHTLRLLNLLNDAWTWRQGWNWPTNSTPLALKISSVSNQPSLVLYGEPYQQYALQYRDNLGDPVWTTTSLTNLEDGQTNIPPFSGNPAGFYRVKLTAPPQ